MAAERQPSPEDGSRSPGRALEAIAAVSGLFLVLAYVSGRIYLQAYYSVFHTELSELDFSVQDIMFESVWSLLGPMLSIAALLAMAPFSRQLGILQHDNDAVGLALAELEPRIEQNVRRQEALSSRLAAEELTTAQLQDEMAAIEGEDTELRQLLNSIKERQRDIATRTPTLSGPLRAAGHIPAPLFTVVLAGAMITTAYAEVYFLAGRASANWGLAGIGIVVPPTFLLVWFAQRSLSPAPRTSFEYFGALAFFSYVVLLVPFVTGLAFAHISTAANKPGSGLATVVVTAERPLDSTWTATGGDYVSPKLRLLGKNGLFLVVWNPAVPNKSYSIPLSTIRAIERGPK